MQLGLPEKGAERKEKLPGCYREKDFEQRKDEVRMNIDWKRPDFVKGTDKPQTLDMIALDVICEGYADSKADAVKYIRQRVPAESWYQANIMKEIKKRAAAEHMQIVIWKAAQGPYSRRGVSDIIALIGGVMLAIEVKRPLFGEPSDLQRAFVRDVNQCGGVAGFCTYPEDVAPLWSILLSKVSR